MKTRLIIPEPLDNLLTIFIENYIQHELYSLHESQHRGTKKERQYPSNAREVDQIKLQNSTLELRENN